MQLPDQMPDGCNFFGLLQTELNSATVAQRFAKAGWNVINSGEQARVEIAWGKLTLTGKGPIELHGWLDRPHDRVGDLLAVLSGPDIKGIYQWIDAEGRLWREMPFDESMLDPDDPRLPADIKESIKASGGIPAAPPPKPWWRFW